MSDAATFGPGFLLSDAPWSYLAGVTWRRAPARVTKPESYKPESCEPESCKPGYCEVVLSDVRSFDEPTNDLATLLGRCAKQDRAAFRSLYDRQAARLHGIALRITRQPALAADAVHDTFIALWQHAGSFDPSRGSAEAWLTSIARYRALDIARRRVREITGIEMPELADPEPDALARLAGSAEVAALRQCLEVLEPDRRNLVLKAFVDGLSHGELAQKLAMPLGTVKSTIRRALAALKRCLEP